MSLELFQKASFEDFVSSISPFLHFPDVEASIKGTLSKSLQDLILSDSMLNNDDVDTIRAYLTVSNVNRLKHRLQTLFTVSNGSLELFQDVLVAVFGHARFGELRIDEDAMKTISAFLANPETLANFVPEFSRNRFRLYPNWRDIMGDEDLVRASLYRSPQTLSDYSVKMGFALENEFGNVVADLGLSYQKGSWVEVNNKEVDLAIPTLDEPRIIVFCSYQLTSASSMTNKANEQTSCYNYLQQFKSRRAQHDKPNIYFVNVVDGAGWLRRRGDLKSMHQNCDFCFSYKTIGLFRDFLRRCFRL